MKNKRKLAAAVTVGILLAFLLLAISYVAFPNETRQNRTLGLGTNNDIFWAILGVGIAALAAMVAVGILLAVTRLRNRISSSTATV